MLPPRRTRAPRTSLRGQAPRGFIRGAALFTACAAGTFALAGLGGCNSDKSSGSVSVNNSTAEPNALRRLMNAITNKPDERKPLTVAEGKKLIEKIRANPAKLQTLSVQEKLFLAKVGYLKDEDDF